VQVPYYESSAKDNVNVDVVFESLAASVKHRLDAKQADEEKRAGATLQLSAEAAPKKKSSCC
jgi:GTPase SAR1 family protein